MIAQIIADAARVNAQITLERGKSLAEAQLEMSGIVAMYLTLWGIVFSASRFVRLQFEPTR